MDKRVIPAGADYAPAKVNEQIALEAIRYDASTGLVPVVVQDVARGHVLMVAYANREALKRTFGTGQAWFWSRSRQDYWRKGATSGNVLQVQEVRVDCDGDAVLYLVNPAGPACHTGEDSCFHRGLNRHVTTEDAEIGTVAGPQPEVAGERGIGAQASSESALDVAVLQALWDVVEERWRNRPAGSYTTYLFEQGVDKSAKKLGEEAVETVLAAKNAATGSAAGRTELAQESADLLYHLMVLWKTCAVHPTAVLQVLKDRTQ